MRDEAKFVEAYKTMERERALAQAERKAMGFCGAAWSGFIAAQGRFHQAAEDEARHLLSSGAESTSTKHGA